jgi:hypothetical protein
MDLLLIKRKFTPLGIQLMFSQYLQHQSQVMFVLLFRLRIYKYVIQEYYEKLV